MPINLSTTSDVLKYTTSVTADTDFHASWIDFDGSDSTPGNSTVISAAATAAGTFVAAPTGANIRSIKTVSVRNKHAATSQDVTIHHYDGTTTPELIKVKLLAGDCLQYYEHTGWLVFTADGRIKYRRSVVMPTTAPNINRVVLAGDVADSSGANTYTDLTAMSFAVVAGRMYWFRFFGVYTSAAGATGSGWSINGPGSPTYLRYKSEYSLTTATRTINEGVAAYDTPATSNATSPTTGSNQAWIEGFIQPSADGTVIVRFMTETNASAITCKAGSVLFWQELLQ